MKKFFLFIIDWIKKKKPDWINLQNFVFAIVITAFFVIVIWSDSFSVYFQQRNAVDVEVLLTATILPGTPTPISEEFLSSAEQTNGVISGAVIVLVAILAGTAVILLRDRK